MWITTQSGLYSLRDVAMCLFCGKFYLDPELMTKMYSSALLGMSAQYLADPTAAFANASSPFV